MPKAGYRKYDLDLLNKVVAYIGDGVKPEYCGYMNCARKPHHVNLCMAHYTFWTRYHKKPKRIRPDMGTVMPYVQDPLHWTKRKAKDTYCHYPNCKSTNYKSRGLCHRHYGWFEKYCNEKGIDRVSYRAGHHTD